MYSDSTLTEKNISGSDYSTTIVYETLWKFQLVLDPHQKKNISGSEYSTTIVHET